MCSEFLRQVNYFSWTAVACSTLQASQGGPWRFCNIGMELIFIEYQLDTEISPKDFFFSATVLK